MILFNNFKAHYQQYKDILDKAYTRVAESGWYVLGKEVESFEKELAAFIGTKYCVGVASGTDAIQLSLKAYGIGCGDEVITTNMTAFPTITAIMQTGATPVVVDIDPKSGLIDPAQIEAKITANTKAIVPVHLYGQSCDLNVITQIAATHQLVVVEDCAQAIGAIFQGARCGSIGHTGSFSFYPTKNLGAMGDGGAITTDDEAIYNKLLMLRNYGQSVRYYHTEEGINSRLDELQAAFLREKLVFLQEWSARRYEIAKYYREHIKTVEFLEEYAHGTPVYHLFVVKHPKRDAMLEYLNANGVQALIHYPVPIARQDAFKGQKEESFEHTELFANQVLSIPIYPELTQAEIDKVVTVINNFNG